MHLSDRFCEALAYAARLHSEQVRKVSGVPYVSHLLRVTGIVLEHGADEDEAIAALLHDAVEDQGGDRIRREISERFGSRVADIVDGCSDTDQQPKPPWRPRKEAYLRRLAAVSASVRLVAAADKLDNARSLLLDCRRMGPSVWDRFSGGRDGTLWYFRRAMEVLKSHGPSHLLAELEEAVAELEKWDAERSGREP